jgi:hypothetical protein
MKEVEEEEFELEAAHCHTVLITRNCNFLILCLSTLWILEF